MGDVIVDLQTIIVIAIVAFAALFVARRMWHTLAASKKKSAAGCANCDAATPSGDDWAR
jgi:hypothetical protein